MKVKNYIYLLVFVVSFTSKAQTAAKVNSDSKFKVNVTTARSVQIEFPVDKNVYNVLVLLMDDSGHTVFLDNQYNFNGIYKRTIDLSKSPNGNYYLKISNDDAIVNKKLSLE